MCIFISAEFPMHEIKDGFLFDNGNMKLADISPSEYLEYKLNQDDILFNRTNSYEHVGRTGIFKLTGEYCFTSYLIRLVINKALALPDYVNYFMSTDHFQTTIKLKATREIAQVNINAQSLGEYLIPLSSSKIQEEIFGKINEEQTLVNANRRLIEVFMQKIRDKPAEVMETGDATVKNESEESENNHNITPEQIKTKEPEIKQAALFTSF